MNSTANIVISVSVDVAIGNVDEFESNLRIIVHAARQSRGCQNYRWFINPDDRHNYVIYGEFDTEENFALYKKSSVVEMIGKQLLPLLEGRPTYTHSRAEVFERG